MPTLAIAIGLSALTALGFIGLGIATTLGHLLAQPVVFGPLAAACIATLAYLGRRCFERASRLLAEQAQRDAITDALRDQLEKRDKELYEVHERARKVLHQWGEMVLALEVAQAEGKRYKAEAEMYLRRITFLEERVVHLQGLYDGLVEAKGNGG